MAASWWVGPVVKAVLQVAVVPERVTPVHPGIGVLSEKNVTVPVGVSVVGLLGSWAATVAVKVTVCPKFDGFGTPDDSVVVVGPTVCVTGLLVDPAVWPVAGALPLYTAVMV
jgi:hypothetical protein